MQRLAFAGLDLQYAARADRGSGAQNDDWQAGSALISHAAPELRLAAVQLLTALARQQGQQAGRQLPPTDQARVDSAFLSLCSAVSTDTVAAIRLEALAGLADLHHASHQVRLQALSKRAMLRVTAVGAAAAVAAGQPGSSAATQQAAAADGGLLDSATGAFVHGMEDDVAQVRIASVAAMLSLGSHDTVFADEAANLLIDLVSDELLEVRLAALQGLVAWAAAHQQRQQQAKKLKLMETQQQEQQDEDQQQQEPVGQQQQEGQQQRDAEQQQQEQRQRQRQQQEAEADESEEEGEVAEKEEQQPDVTADYPQQRQPTQQQEGPAGAASAANQLTGANKAAGCASSRPGGAKRGKKRKSDLPPWGVDGLAAAIGALRDRNAKVRVLALQLAVLLPPLSLQAVMALLQGLVACCKRFGAQHREAALAVVRHVAQQRTVLVAQSSLNLAKLFARATGVRAAGTVAAAGGDGHVQSPVAVELVQEIATMAASMRPQMLQSLFFHMDQQGVLQLEVLQPFVEHLKGLQQQCAPDVMDVG